MIRAYTKAEVREAVRQWKKEGLTVGLVPTMGYLHEGHASLVDKAVSMCDRVVVSDFVNPTQFGPNEDLESYPRDFERDCALLEEHGASLVFHPEPAEMYDPDAATFVEILSEMPLEKFSEKAERICSPKARRPACCFVCTYPRILEGSSP